MPADFGQAFCLSEGHLAGLVCCLGTGHLAGLQCCFGEVHLVGDCHQVPGFDVEPGCAGLDLVLYLGDQELHCHKAPTSV